MKRIIILSILVLTACASLRPIESTSKEVPNELSQEIQDKFQVAETSGAVKTPSVEVKSIKKKTTKSKTKVTKVTKDVSPVAAAPVIKKFAPIVGQRLIFAVYAPLGVRAGTLITKVEGYKFINNKEVVLLKANVYNAAFFASIFTVNLLIESYVDPIDFKSVRYQVTGQEGKLNKNTLELYDYENNNIIEYKSQLEKGGQKTSNQSTNHVLTAEVAQDILSSFWKVVSLDFNKQLVYTFSVASGNSFKTARVVKLSDYEDGWVLGLSFDDKQNPEDRKIFLNTKTNLVDKIEASIKWGKFKVIRVEEE